MPWNRLQLRRLLLGCCVWGCLGYASEEQSISYNVIWQGMEDHPVLPLLIERSRSVQLQHAPPATERQLERRMRNDLPVFREVLATEGFFLADVTGSIEQTDGTYEVKFHCTPGKQIRIATYHVVYPEHQPPRAEWEPLLQAGDPVTTSMITLEEQRALQFFQRAGHPFPSV